MIEARSIPNVGDTSAWQGKTNGTRPPLPQHNSNSRSHGKNNQDDPYYVIAKYDYKAQGSHELDLRKHERYLLLDDSKHWWRVQNNAGYAGYIPSNYVKRDKPSLFDSIKKKVKKGGAGSSSSGSGKSKTLPTGNSPCRNIESPVLQRRLPIDPSEAIGTAIVKYNYQAQQPDELSLTKGARILILEKSNDGWWRGQSGCSAGWFPSNYTQEEVDPDDTVHTYAMAENVIDIVVALYPFNATSDQELSFEKGERMEVLDRPPTDPEWYKARNSHGQIGLVPKNYVQELSEYLTQPIFENGKDARGELDQVGNVADRTWLIGKQWYYGNISRGQCDTLLNTHGLDGDFLIRDSETNAGDFSVSLKAPVRNKHFRVHVENNMYCIGQRRFHSLDQLVDHYQRAPIYTNKQGEKLYLVRPLPKVTAATNPSSSAQN